ILGCTHYPYLMPILTKFAPREIFIDPAEYMKTLAIKSPFPFSVEFFVSSNPAGFIKNAKLFMEINSPVFETEIKSSVGV
ncbi:MAG: hypothetical protein LUE64_07100, partial [Candidatus Gastranaerophilales bacterium]|nr:hypothetical protein [Candidatus Gastranaerophilales bacterium]